MISFFKRKKWLLPLVDVGLILLSTQLSPWIRFGRYFDIFEYHTVATVVTLILYLINLYIVDLYNIDRNFYSKWAFLRLSVAVCLAGLISMVVFYSLPQLKYGRGILLLQMILVWIFLALWRQIFSKFFL